MPEMGGSQLFEELQRLRLQLPVLFMSGHIDNPDLPTEAENRCFGFLQKPFAPEALLESIRKLLAMSKEP